MAPNLPPFHIRDSPTLVRIDARIESAAKLLDTSVSLNYAKSTHMAADTKLNALPELKPERYAKIFAYCKAKDPTH